MPPFHIFEKTQISKPNQNLITFRVSYLKRERRKRRRLFQNLGSWFFLMKEIMEEIEDDE